MVETTIVPTSQVSIQTPATIIHRHIATACNSDDDGAGEVDCKSYIDYIGCKEIVG